MCKRRFSSEEEALNDGSADSACKSADVNLTEDAHKRLSSSNCSASDKDEGDRLERVNQDSKLVLKE